MCVPNDVPNDSHIQWNESFEEWTSICRHCFRNISARRPPIYNADNCSCAEVGRSTSGDAAMARVIEPQLYQYNDDVAAAAPAQQAQSSASSFPSGPWVEGPEHEAPNMVVANSNRNSYLEVAPRLGHNEFAHRRNSIRSHTSYPVRQWLTEQATLLAHNNSHFHTHTPTQPGPSGIGYLPLGVHIQSDSLQVHKSSMRSKPSWKGEGLEYERETFPGYDMDPLTHAGAWAREESGLRRWEGAYPVFMGEMFYRDFEG